MASLLHLPYDIVIENLCAGKLAARPTGVSCRLCAEDRCPDLARVISNRLVYDPSFSYTYITRQLHINDQKYFGLAISFYRDPMTWEQQFTTTVLLFYHDRHYLYCLGEVVYSKDFVEQLCYLPLSSQTVYSVKPILPWVKVKTI